MSLSMNVLISGLINLLVLPATFPWQLNFSKEVRFLSEATRKELEEKIKHLTDKMGIKKEIVLMELDGSLTSAEAMGCCLLPGKAGIGIYPGFIEISEGEQEFILAHELSHIKNNDMLSSPIFSGFVHVISTVAIGILFPSTIVPFSSWLGYMGSYSPAVASGCFISIVAMIVFNRWREERADIAGFAACSDQGKKGALSVFQKKCGKNLTLRNDLFAPWYMILLKSLLISPKGDDRLDLLHPLLSSRIKNLQQCASAK